MWYDNIMPVDWCLSYIIYMVPGILRGGCNFFISRQRDKMFTLLLRAIDMQPVVRLWLSQVFRGFLRLST